MNIVLKLLVFLLAPLAVFAADSTISLQPPATDASYVFLSTIFGVVDGVLHGNGSQIMGRMFSIFNTAVLALGGIIVMYTLVVSTLNTAHEGQFLGQKFSSIWVPVRTTAGLALLLPKASGYCMAQIFVMWVIVQGIGAADKVWGGALDYLNRGGVIIQSQVDTRLQIKNSGTDLPMGARAILEGQVCMLGLENYLKKMQADQKANNKCVGSLCNISIPDLIATVNLPSFVAGGTKYSPPNQTVSADPNQAINVIPMPWIKNDKDPLYPLNGICGFIAWNTSTLGTATVAQTTNIGSLLDVRTYAAGAVPGISSDSSSSNFGVGFMGMGLDEQQVSEYSKGFSNSGVYSTNPYEAKLSKKGSGKEVSAQSAFGYSDEDVKVIEQSRGLAVQQMYDDLIPVAKVIVTNAVDSSFAGLDYTGDATSNWYRTPFGLPFNTKGQPCSQIPCQNWGNNAGGNLPFTGREIWDAISDYQGVMSAYLHLQGDLADGANGISKRIFMEQSRKEGWLYAGNYFWDLIRLNGNAAPKGNNTDTQSGLAKSQGPVTYNVIAQACQTNSPFVGVCKWFGYDPSNEMSTPATYASFLSALNQTLVGQKAIQNTDIFKPQTPSPISGATSNTVEGYLTNAMTIESGGQAELQKTNFGKFPIELKPVTFSMGQIDFGCARFFVFCMGWLFDMAWNHLIAVAVQIIANLMSSIVMLIIQVVIFIPLSFIADIFNQGIGIISQPGVNPVLAVGNMGGLYVNYLGEFISTLIGTIAGITMSPWGTFLLPLMAVITPLLLAIVALLGSVGFVAAYYAPLIPYLTFLMAGLAWFILVIEAVAAAPIVALGVTHPEGHEAFGKAETSLNLIISIFLRPSLMIIGYIAGISLSYIGVWMLNAGFQHAMLSVNTSSQYVSFTKSLGYFLQIIIYISVYMTIVEKAFSLIAILPDKVMRWIGHSESAGQESLGWAGEAKQKAGEAGKEITGGLQSTGNAALQQAQKYQDKKDEKKKDQGPSNANVDAAPNAGGGEIGGAGGAGGAGGGVPPVVP